MKRCISPKRERLSKHSFLYALSEQPLSWSVSLTMRLRMRFAMREKSFFENGSFLFQRHPLTQSYPSLIFAMSLGMSAGSFWRSASSVIRIVPCACFMPASIAAVWPKFLRNLIMLTRESFSWSLRSS